MAKRVALFLTCSWLLLGGGHLYSGDEVLMARVTEALVTRGSLVPRLLDHFRDYARVQGRDQESHAWYAVGPSLVAVPFYLLGMALERVADARTIDAFQDPVILFYDRQDRSEVLRYYGISWTNAFVTAVVALILFGLLRQQGLSDRSAALWTLAFGLTGIVPFYARSFFSEPLGALIWMGGIAAWTRARDSLSPPWSFLSGAIFGALPLARVALGAGLPVAALAIGVDLWKRRDRAPRVLVRTVPWGLVGAMISLGVWAGSNSLRFGHPFETGYTGVLNLFGGDPHEGLAGLLVSPGRGLLWYVPWVALAIVGLPRLVRRDPSLVVFSGGLLVALLALHAPWAMWDGGWCFGPRFLFPALPALVIPAALGSLSWKRTFPGRVGIALVVGASALVAVASVLVNYEDYHFALWSSFAESEAVIRWDPEWSPLWRYWTWPRKDFLIVPRLLAGDGGRKLAALAWGLLLVWCWAGVRLVLALRRSPSTIESSSASR